MYWLMGLAKVALGWAEKLCNFIVRCSFLPFSRGAAR
jgi:hypothetical protein